MTTETHDASHASTTAPRWRDLPAPLWALVVARAVNRVGAFTLPFLGVVLVDRLGTSAAVAGALVALFGVATIPSRLLGGVLADRLGPVPTMTVGLVGCAVGQLQVAAAGGLAAAAVGVVVLGLAFEVYEPPSQALVADLVGDRLRPIAYGALSAALAGAGLVAGPLAVRLGGIDVRGLLVADAVSCLVAAGLVVAVVRPALRHHAASPASGTSAPPTADLSDAPAPSTPATTPSPTSPWRDRRLLVLLAAGTAFATVYLALVTVLPLALPRIGQPPEHAGLVVTVAAVVVVAGQPLLRWGPLRPTARALVVGYLLLAFGLALLAVAHDLTTVLLAAVVWSLGDLLLLGHLLSLVSGLAPAGARARWLAAYGLSWGVATALAPLLGTQLLVHGGPALLWGTLAVVALGLAALQPALARPRTP
ncbi:MFS transporter [Lapillicoccus jejuensis]|uniref:Putative MFS family arabinose efflux permease n=1 Tax=Lapillicoccus jejuensis TaxID=402171 RepID=A0A542DYB2_9MICO|nr:MFS transporter [Lapillicoccus jejuensis]TQJ08075.1 putative MFS family arabinose efflux permease [Lapillicoccus jejuensis]